MSETTYKSGTATKPGLLDFFCIILVVGVVVAFGIFVYKSVVTKVDGISKEGEVFTVTCVNWFTQGCEPEAFQTTYLPTEDLTNRTGNYQAYFKEFQKAMSKAGFATLGSREFFADESGKILSDEELFEQFYNASTNGISYNKSMLFYSQFFKRLEGDIVKPVLTHNDIVAYYRDNKIVSTQPLSEAPKEVQSYLGGK